MSEYNHIQTIPSSTWTIGHNLDVVDTINDVMVDTGAGLEKVLPNDVVHTNDNTLTITFTGNKTGRARIVG